MKAQVVNSTSISVEWKPPEQKEQHGVIVGYQIYIQETDNGEKLLGEPLFYLVQNGSALTYLVTDLQPDSKYQVQVAAMTRKGDGTRTSPIVVRTPGGVPSRPTLQIR